MSNARVLLINPPFYRLMNSHFNSLSLGICYIASVLRKNDFDVGVYNADHLDTDKYGSQRELFEGYYNYKEVLNNPGHPIWREALGTVKKFSPDAVGITMLTGTSKSSENIARLVKEWDEDVKIVVGGTHPTLLPLEMVKKDCFDYAITYEGEYPFLELMGGEKEDCIKNLVYLDGKGKPVMNEKRPLIENLDELPFPARDLFIGNHKHVEYGAIITGRGCPYQCTFCASRKIWGLRTRYRSVANVLDEIEEVYHAYRAKVFNFRDDTFTIDQKRAQEICKGIVDMGLDIRWMCDTRVNLLKKETLEWMKKAGCARVRLGIESGSDRILELCKKGITREQVFRAASILKEVGLDYTAYLMIGFPTETDEDVRQTIELAKKIDARYYSLSIAAPYYGTEIYDYFAKEGRALPEENWEYFFHQSDDMILTHKIGKETIGEFLSLNETLGKEREIKE
jgi:anaerobic magnesium-protoporphyrin IX monomethyl ester cyclase